MDWVYDDGGREAAGFVGDLSDCAVRSVSIVTNQPYRRVYGDLRELKRWLYNEYRIDADISPTVGVDAYIWKTYLEVQGFKEFGPLYHNEMLKGRVAISMDEHASAMVDGVIHDTGNPLDYGHYIKGYMAKV